MRKLCITFSIAFFSLWLTLSYSQTTKILFIGNSLTGFYDQPEMFYELSTLAGHNVLSFDGTAGGVSMAEHLNRTATLEKLELENWDYIVLQGSSYAIAFSEDHHLLYPTYIAFKEIIQEKSPNAKIIFFMDWALRDGVNAYNQYFTYNEFQDKIFDGTMAFADSMGFITSPVGFAFQHVVNDTSSIDVFFSDGSHPSRHGSYLAACVYFYLVFGEAQEEPIPYLNELKEYEAFYLQSVAEKTVLDSIDLWYSSYDSLDTGNQILLSSERNYDIQIYPQPATGFINVICDPALKPTSYSLISLNGQIISTGQLLKNHASILLPFLPGIYILQINSRNSIITRKVSIQ